MGVQTQRVGGRAHARCKARQREFEFLDYPDAEAVKDAVYAWLPSNTAQLERLASVQMPILQLNSMMPLSLHSGRCQRLILRFEEIQDDYGGVPFPGEKSIPWMHIVYWCWIHDFEIEEKRWDEDSCEYYLRIRPPSPMAISALTTAKMKLNFSR